MALPTYMNDLYMLGLNPNYKPEDPEHPQVKAYLERRAGDAVPIKRGEEIFEGLDYPREWAGFVGQGEAKEQMIVHIASAKARGARLDHTLLASGQPGIGKTTLATLLAYQAGAGLVRSGALDLAAARKTILAMRDRDVLFIDEIHAMAKQEWLLPFMLEGKLYTETGEVDCPDITIVGATTDVGKLPATIIGRFSLKPQLAPYTASEATQIVGNLALRMNVTLAGDEAQQIAQASSGNPRDMRSILERARDLQFAFPDAPLDLETAFRWAGFSADGLTKVAREMLLVLSQQANYTCSIDTLGAMLNEPGPLRHQEQALMQRGYITITGRGRQLTPAGLGRVRDMAHGEI